MDILDQLDRMMTGEVDSHRSDLEAPCEDFADEVRRLRTQVAELEKDRERLDWLNLWCRCAVLDDEHGTGVDLSRDAIDAAMRAEREE